MGKNQLEHNYKLTQEDLHSAFLHALEPMVISHSSLLRKPLEAELKPPLPHKIRLYIFNATHPPGGRTLGEHKIQLIVPGQERGNCASFDHTGSRIVLLMGYEPELEVFILWDAGVYSRFAYSRNVQVKAETILTALTGGVGQQERNIRGHGIETVLTARANSLSQAILLRMKLTRQRLLKV